MTAVRVKMGTNGRLVVPAGLRKEIGLADGRSVLLEAVKGELRVRPMEVVVQHAQDRLRKFLGDKKSLSEDLIADRRAEADPE
ncbi:MAG: AbrB/MazE/SpoVT family DNA-binding domain-containing protein [Rhodobacteraceae bacterium]|nr:AbrB/MazE/SpoVT family DNA-binding domain-containing protein [Paracoccaceae bacterium]